MTDEQIENMISDMVGNMPLSVLTYPDRLIVARRILARNDGYYPPCPPEFDQASWKLILEMDEEQRTKYAVLFLILHLEGDMINEEEQ